MKGQPMIDKNELDAQTIAQAEIIADEIGITLDEFLQIVDEAKQEFYKTQLS